MDRLIVALFLLFSISVIAQDTITKPQLSVISLDKVKVVYRGIDNPIRVAVPNAKSYTVSGAGVFLNKDETYSIRPGVGLETKVYVEIILEDDSFVVEEHIYQIKGLPMPIPTLNDNYSPKGKLLFFTLNELKNSEVGVKFIDFIYGNLSPYVTQFSIKVPRQPTLNIEGNIITDEAINLIKKAKRKDIIIINSIHTNYMNGYGCHQAITPLIFQIEK